MSKQFKAATETSRKLGVLMAWESRTDGFLYTPLCDTDLPLDFRYARGMVRRSTRVEDEITIQAEIAYRVPPFAERLRAWM